MLSSHNKVAEVWESKETRIKKAKYLTYEEFLKHLDKLNEDNFYNNLKFQDFLHIKTTGNLFMLKTSKIITRMWKYLGFKRNTQIEQLFTDATGLFNALGSWVYGDRNGKIVFPALNTFLQNTSPI
ncbi:hypothetical protein LCGC14_0756970 [marine sediment metagenome]|uniref:Uncharacterized protein n=1 Tax=marine sediment metagenome TaxID=412755 RepID=A0A0F9QM50_9ZZZZ